jgi:hypothetical protein
MTLFYPFISTPMGRKNWLRWITQTHFYGPAPLVNPAVLNFLSLQLANGALRKFVTFGE